ncbi:MAG: hypothetical protein WDM89_00125 [Rhizomicrobium sp.]
MSTGIIAGLKLPTGDSTYPNFDSDVEIGSGSTDLLLGAYHTGPVSSTAHGTTTRRSCGSMKSRPSNQYTPGSELNGAVGVSWQGWTIGTAQISPLFQLIASYRGRDGGAAGDNRQHGV